MSRKGKKHKLHDGSDVVELNIMPFIDIFSLLCTFLLFSAVFVAVGIHVVQIPFLSNAAPEKGGEDNKRTMKVKVDVSVNQITLTTSWSLEPIDEKTQKFTFNSGGQAEFHQALIKIKQDNMDADKVDLYVDDGVNYDQIISLLDDIKLTTAKDPPMKLGESHKGMDYLFPKVVMGSVVF